MADFATDEFVRLQRNGEIDLKLKDAGYYATEKQWR